MNKILKASLGVVAAATIAATSAISAFAWGPSRTTYTLAKPAPHITFNSITDNHKEVGDERYFVSASPYTGNAANNVWRDDTVVEDGKEYVVRMYVHNNAASNLNLVAENVRAYVVLPTEASSSITVDGKIYSSNANPTTVWDNTTFKSANGENFHLTYVNGSAKYYNTKNGTLRTFNLDTPNNDLFTSNGVLLGYDQMDGKIPGCNEYSGYVTFHVKAAFTSNVKITKEVRLDGTGSNAWTEAVKANPGDIVNYRIGFQNLGSTTMNNVMIRDILPPGLTLVKGTTKVYNPNNPNGVIVSDNIVSETGINIGSYAANANAWIYFSAKVDSIDKLSCGNSILRNIVQANGGFGTREDKADVAVTGKTCKENPPKECKPGIPEGDARCTTIPTPPKLPQTGPASVAGAIIGAGSLVTAGTYYILSRKKLN